MKVGSRDDRNSIRYCWKHVTKVEKSSLLLETLQRMLKSPGAKVGTVLFVLIVLACVCAPLIAPYGPNAMDLENMFASPSSSHWLGTDGLGATS